MKALQDQFKLSEKVMTAFKESKADSLTELRFMFANEEEAGNYVKAIKDLEDAGILVARVRHMWHAIRQQASVRESCKSRIDEADLDAELEMLEDEMFDDELEAADTTPSYLQTNEMPDTPTTELPQAELGVPALPN